MIRTENLRIHYNSGVNIHFPDLNCSSGSHWLVLGSSGSGKTSLLNILSGIRTPSHGKVWINQRDIFDPKFSDRARWIASHLGFALQKPVFVSALSVRDNLTLCAKLSGKEIKEKEILLWLDKVGLGSKMNSYTFELSAGQQQRLGFIRACLHNPEILLADEPSSALDDENAENLIKLMIDQSNELQSTLIVVSHDHRIKSFFQNQMVLS